MATQLCFATQTCVFNKICVFSHKIKCQVPYEFVFSNALGVLDHYPFTTCTRLYNIFNLSNNTTIHAVLKYFIMKIGGKISFCQVLPSTAISGSIAQPAKTRVFPLGFSRAVNTLPTLSTLFAIPSTSFELIIHWQINRHSY